MKDKGFAKSVEVKKVNITHHDAEAEVFERSHPEGSSFYERSQVSKSLALIAENSARRNLCVDVGCGTGFVTGFELPLYETVVAIDISRRMLQVAKRRLGHLNSLNLLVCDAEFLPLESGIADLVSVSSVLHHLPAPSKSIAEVSRVIDRGGFLYVTREPNSQHVRKFFEFFDQAIIHRLVKMMLRSPVFGSEVSKLDATCKSLNSEVDIHYASGFQATQIAEFLFSRSFEVICAYSYHWIYPDSDKGLISLLLTKSNTIIEKIPLSKKFGRYVSLVARKLEQEADN
jgi:ubiquinone/menaquinone biosynthesis C-methylase UbiE